MSVRIYRSDELPPEVPAALFTEGDQAVLLVNTAALADRSYPWFREMTNSLLAEAGDTAPPGLSAVG